MNDKQIVKEEGTIKELIESERFKLAVASSLPAHLRPDRFVRIALTAMLRTPKLQQCDQASFFQCLLTLSQLGLEPDGRHAHLIPFWNSKRNVTECQVIVDYRGLVELAMRSGKISYVHADSICKKDEFEYDKGQVKKHEIDFKSDRGEPYAYYALCRFKDGTEKCEVMTKAEVEKIRQRSRAKNEGPWVTDFEQMARKTVFRRLSKWLPLSSEYRDAADLDMDALEELRFDNAKPLIQRAKVPKLTDKELSGGPEKGATSSTDAGGSNPQLVTQDDVTLNGEPLPAQNKSSEKWEEFAKASEPENAPDPIPPIDKPPEKKTEKLGRKKKVPSTEALTPYGEKQVEMEKRLKIGGFTTDDLMTIAYENGWAEGKWPVPEETLDRFLTPDNWQVITEELEALKK